MHSGMEGKLCTGKTAAGKACKRTATTGGCCYQHTGSSDISKSPRAFGTKVSKGTPTIVKAVPRGKTRQRSPEEHSPDRHSALSPRYQSSPKSSGKKKAAKVRGSPPVSAFGIEGLSDLPEEWRTDRISPGMGNLGWSPTKAKFYTKPENMQKMALIYPQHADKLVPFPPAFALVADKLEKICETIPFGSCQLHPIMPGMQWTNERDRYRNAEIEFKKSMWQKGNHYFHDIKTSENENYYPVFDREYCMCHETHAENIAVPTLSLPLVGEDEKLKELHWYLADDSRLGGSGTPRDIIPALRKKILADTIDFLGQEYKIHLQPKPEYQLPVIRALVKLISTDPLFASHIESWKTIIPYDRVTTGLNLPVVVIYPCKGQKSATLVLKKIIQVFGKFDCAKIGLNHTPRFNHKINELIYYANGSGDHKKILPDKFFAGPNKEFYKGHELHL